MNIDLSVLAQADVIDWSSLTYAVLLLLIGLALAIIEVFVVSFGLLGAASLASLGASIYFAFRLGSVAGWLFIFVATVLIVSIARWGLNRIRESSIVPTASIRSDAGYRHVAERIGVAIGSTGVMVTPARPSGRARFPGGECDVQARGYALERGASVVVKRIDGPIIFVAPVDAEISKHS